MNNADLFPEHPRESGKVLIRKRYLGNQKDCLSSGGQDSSDQFHIDFRFSAAGHTEKDSRPSVRTPEFSQDPVYRSKLFFVQRLRRFISAWQAFFRLRPGFHLPFHRKHRPQRLIHRTAVGILHPDSQPDQLILYGCFFRIDGFYGLQFLRRNIRAVRDLRNKAADLPFSERNRDRRPDGDQRSHIIRDDIRIAFIYILI